MRFNPHSQLAGKHAPFGASKGSWVNYPEEKLERVFLSNMAAQRGTDLHSLANDMIRLGVRARDEPTTFNMYVNDAIGYRLKPEVTLFYSLNFFGTVDTCGFRKNVLRLSELKTGSLRAGERQLDIYAALFCLEYNFKPHNIQMEMRVYQNDEIREWAGDPDVIVHIMDRITTFDRIIERMREEAE